MEHTEKDCYKLINQHCGSAKLGNCEICHKPVDSVYSQTHQQTYKRPNGTTGRTEIGSAFGHKLCLLELRRKNYGVYQVKDCETRDQ